MSLTFRIAGGLAAVALAALSVAGALVVVGVENRTRELAGFELDELARALQRRRADLRVRLDDSAAQAARELAVDAGLMQQAMAGGEAAAGVGRRLMEGAGLDVLWLLQTDGRVLSAGHWPARVGARRPDLAARPDDEPFVSRTRVRNETWPVLVAVASLPVRGQKRLRLAAGIRLDTQVGRWSTTDESVAFALVDGAGSWLGRRPPGFPLSTWPGSPAPGQAASRRRTTIAGEDWLLVSRRLAGDEAGEPIDLVAARSLAPLQRWHRRLLGSIGMVALLATAVAGLSGLWLARRLGRPIRELTDMTSRMAAGDLDGRLPVRSRDEVGRLAASFNHMADALRAGRRDLARSERLAAWRDAARRMAHEVKNPLAPIRMSVENLQRARAATPEAFERFFAEECRTILEEVDALRRLVDEFSRFARLPEPRRRPVAPDVLVRHAAELYRESLGEVTLDVEIDADLPLLSVDPELLGQVLKNLLRNALQALQEERTAGGRVVLQCSRQDDHVVLSVRDNGPGIPESIRDRLFEPRVTTKASGSGLGLAISRQIVEKHGGRIECSTGDDGTVFEIVLPVTPDGAVEEQRE